MSVKGKTVVITGASSGIGEETTRLLASKGANLVIGARRVSRLKKIAREIPNHQVIYQKTDVTDPNSVKNLLEKAHRTFNSIDVLFNNAGLMPISNLNQLKISEWNTMIDVNIKGVLYGIAAALPIMEKQKYGQIISTDSVAGHKVGPGLAVYDGTKFAVRAIMEGLRQEEVQNNIKSTIISPGAVETELYTTTSDPKVKSDLRKQEVQGLKVKDIANGILYAINQPENVSINEVLLRPVNQKV